MDGLKINYSETISVGNQVTEKGGEFQELLNKVKATNSELKTYWEGSDASKYSTSVAPYILHATAFILSFMLASSGYT